MPYLRETRRTADISTNCDLVFGLLALPNGLIDQGQFVAAFQAWTRDRARPLADHLVRRGSSRFTRTAAQSGSARCLDADALCTLEAALPGNGALRGHPLWRPAPVFTGEGIG